MNRTLTRILFLAIAGAGLGLASCQSAPVPEADPEAQVKGTMTVNTADKLKISDIMFGDRKSVV